MKEIHGLILSELELLKEDGIVIPEKINKTDLESVNRKISHSFKWVVIIDGTTFSLIEKAQYIEKDFFRLSLCACSLICCWVSPD